MQTVSLGVIGCGNMASAILAGTLHAEFLTPKRVRLFDINVDKLHALSTATQVPAAASLKTLAQDSDFLLLAVKPDTVETVIKQLGDTIVDKALISIALGWDFARLQGILPKGARAVFVMPNTPCQVGEGMSLIEAQNNLSPQENQFVRDMFSSIGTAEVVKSSLMGVAGTLSGCGPAFIYMAIEALADGAVTHGLPRDTAYRLASQMVLGAGKMVLESTLHPAQLKDNVCSPGGSTIRGVAALEAGAFRAALIDAIDKAARG